MSGRQLFQYHPTFGYTFIPGLKARVDHEGGGYLVQVNQAGFRCNHEFTQDKPPGVFRVIVFGDSYTAGDGVSNKYRYTDVLEGLLPGVEVFNYGLPGSGTDQQYLIFREMTAGLSYDLLVISILVENIRRIASRYRPYISASGETLIMAKPYFTLNANGTLALHHCPVPKDPIDPDALPSEEWQHIDQGGNLATLRKLVNKLGGRAKGLAQRLSRYQPVPAYDRSDNPDWLLMKAILKQWISESKTRTVVFLIPLHQFVEETSSPKAYQDRFRELHAPPAVQVHDALPDLLHFPKTERRAFRFQTDVHPTAALHCALAESLAGQLKPFIEH